MGLFSRNSSGSSDSTVNARTGRPFKSDSEFWGDLAKDARRRAEAADTAEGREAMEQNARDFERRSR
jgi:hypothetical protein